MATPLTDSINALTQYANETTGKQDTTLSDAVGSLVDGYGGGSSGESAWTKVAEAEYQVSTTNTSTKTVATLETGNPAIWTSQKWVYVRVYDTAGKRAGYFYGSDSFFLKNPNMSAGLNNHTYALRAVKSFASSNGNATMTLSSTTSGTGVYADQISNNGNIRIRSKYNNSTIDSTYKVEVFLLDMPGGILPFGE